tara:strand:- start:43 stop:1299 length:1257 start_codon:yes stop_codon:yes gene_type:complete
MALPSAGLPMSMSMLNTELGDGEFDTVDLKAASIAFGEDAAPYGMDELAGLSATAQPTFTSFTATGGNGQIVINWNIGNSPDSISLKVSNASNMSSPTELTTVNDGTHTQTGLSPSTQKFYQLTATNDGGTATSAIINATSTGTTWGAISGFNMHLVSGGSSETLQSDEKSLTLTNGSGNSLVTIEQPNNSSPPPTLEMVIGTISRSDTNYNLINSFTDTPGSIQNTNTGTYFMKFKLTQIATKTNAAEDCTISFTNNSVQRTFEINARITSGLGGFCIHESMLVDTPNGLKSIYELNVGDLVNSYDSELGIVESVPIDEIIKPTHKNLYKVNSLILTEDHPIFDKNGKLLSVNPDLSKERYGLETNKLEIGRKLKTLNNEELVVDRIRKYNGEYKTYTILTKNHNFFVDGILVHSEI